MLWLAAVWVNRMMKKDERYPVELVAMKENGSRKTLSVLNTELSKRAYLAGDTYSIADMSVFAYVHLADEAGIVLTEYPNVGRWVGDIQKQPGFLSMTYPYSMDPYSVRDLP